MLEDRDYMRAGKGNSRRPVTVSVWLILLIANIAVFFAEYAGGPGGYRAFMQYGALSLEGVKHGFVWQFLTFQFLHGGLPHLVLNSIVLYSFGRPMEEMIGRRTFLRLYLASGFAGGVAQILLSLVSERFAGPM